MLCTVYPMTFKRTVYKYSGWWTESACNLYTHKLALENRWNEQIASLEYRCVYIERQRYTATCISVLIICGRLVDNSLLRSRSKWILSRSKWCVFRAVELIGCYFSLPGVDSLHTKSVSIWRMNIMPLEFILSAFAILHTKESLVQSLQKRMQEFFSYLNHVLE